MPDLIQPAPNPLPAPWDRIFSLGSRIFVWVVIGSLIYLLRPFFLLVFLTFVFAYVQAHGVDGLGHRLKQRWVRAVLVFAVLLGALSAIGVYLGPHVRDQVVTVASKYDEWISNADLKLKAWADERKWKDFPPAGFTLRKLVEDVLGLIDTEPPSDETGDTVQAPNRTQPAGESNVQRVLDFMKGAANWIVAIGSAFFLSLLFSFLIVLDLPKLTRSVQGLAHTKIAFIYTEVADSVYSFCKVLGRAMEAQLLIAICNTVLTAIGLWAIGLVTGSTVFLCTIVFLCSFIPVAGVFISSTPICIVALSEYGPGKMVLSIAMILIIHFIEAYFLNPRIYGHHLRMNPVLTLIILTVCGKLFGPWGLILGIPVLNYVFTHAIRYRGLTQVPSASAPNAATAESA